MNSFQDINKLKIFNKPEKEDKIFNKQEKEDKIVLKDEDIPESLNFGELKFEEEDDKPTNIKNEDDLDKLIRKLSKKNSNRKQNRRPIKKPQNSYNFSNILLYSAIICGAFLGLKHYSSINNNTSELKPKFGI